MCPTFKVSDRFTLFDKISTNANEWRERARYYTIPFRKMTRRYYKIPWGNQRPDEKEENRIHFHVLKLMEQLMLRIDQWKPSEITRLDTPRKCITRTKLESVINERPSLRCPSFRIRDTEIQEPDLID